MELAWLQMHLWQSDSWQPEWGHEIMSNYERCFTNQHGAFCQSIKTAMAPAQAASQHAFHRRHAEWRAKHTPEAVKQAKLDAAIAKAQQESSAAAEAPFSAVQASRDQSVSTAKSARLLRAGAF